MTQEIAYLMTQENPFQALLIIIILNDTINFLLNDTRKQFSSTAY